MTVTTRYSKTGRLEIFVDGVGVRTLSEDASGDIEQIVQIAFSLGRLAEAEKIRNNLELDV
jgi:hypothetical protein